MANEIQPRRTLTIPKTDDMNTLISYLNNALYNIQQRIDRQEGRLDQEPVIYNNVDLNTNRITQLGKSQGFNDACPRSELVDKALYTPDGRAHYASIPIMANARVKTPAATIDDEAVNLGQLEEGFAAIQQGWNSTYLPAMAMTPDPNEGPIWRTLDDGLSYIYGWWFHPDFIDDDYVWGSVLLPADYQEGQDAYIIIHSTETDGSAKHKWQIEYVWVNDQANYSTDGCYFNIGTTTTALTEVDHNKNTVDSQLWEPVSVTFSDTTTTARMHSMIRFRINRIAASSNDDYAVLLLGASLVYPIDTVASTGYDVRNPD